MIYIIFLSVIIILVLLIILRDIKLKYEKLQKTNDKLRAEYSILKHICNPTIEQEIQMLDTYRITNNTDEHIVYSYYQHFCMENNIYLDKKYNSYFIEFCDNHPHMREKYKDYIRKLS